MISPVEKLASAFGAAAVVAGVAGEVKPVSAQGVITQTPHEPIGHTVQVPGGKMPSEQAFNSLLQPYQEQVVNPEQQKEQKLRVLQTVIGVERLWQLKEDESGNRFVYELKIKKGTSGIESTRISIPGIEKPTALAASENGRTVAVGGEDGKIIISTTGEIASAAVTPPIGTETGRTIGQLQVMGDGSILAKVDNKNDKNDYYNMIVSPDGNTKQKLEGKSYLDTLTVFRKQADGSYKAYGKAGAAGGYYIKTIRNGILTEEFKSTGAIRPGGLYEYIDKSGNRVLMLVNAPGNDSIGSTHRVINDGEPSLFFKPDKAKFPTGIIQGSGYSYQIDTSGIAINEEQSVMFVAVVVRERRIDPEFGDLPTKDVPVFLSVSLNNTADQVPSSVNNLPDPNFPSGMSISLGPLLQEDGKEVLVGNFKNTGIAGAEGNYGIEVQGRNFVGDWVQEDIIDNTILIPAVNQIYQGTR